MTEIPLMEKPVHLGTGITRTAERTIERVAQLSIETVVMNKRVLNPIPLTKVVIGESVWREFICTAGCTVCCNLIDGTLDYLPTESAWEKIGPGYQKFFHEITYDLVIDGKLNEVSVMTADKWDPTHRKCKMIVPYRRGDVEHDGCALWPSSPIECWAAPLIHVSRPSNRPDTALIQKKGFGRSWRYERKGFPMQCQFISDDKIRDALEADIDVLSRYREWAEGLGLHTPLTDIINVYRGVREGTLPIQRYEISVAFPSQITQFSADGNAEDKLNGG